MKTNHGAVINKRMRDNYSEIMKDMTSEERAWAEKFEQLEYAVERGFALEAVGIAEELNPSVSKEALLRIREGVEVKDRCNPVKAEYDVKRFAEQRKTERSAPANMYDAYDWHRTGGTVLDYDGIATERGITVSPEDALVAVLDAARINNVSLGELINNPRYRTPERKAGRPKKVSE